MKSIFAFFDEFLFPIIFILFLVFLRSSPYIRWKCYKNTAKNRTKKENIKIYKNKMLSVIKVSIELTTNGKKKFKLKMMNNEYYELIEY